MDETYLYQKIFEEIRQGILVGKLKPGDRLPPVRQMVQRWDCTIGTVQRAYQELARQGLVTSRPGQGTHVIKAIQPAGDTALRRANLVHRSEAFLLEALTAGHSVEEVEAALQQALERWQVIAHLPTPPEARALRFAGSHDLALAWLAAHFPEIAPQFTMQLGFCGSLGGLIALAEGNADLAGCHLWDEESDSYNAPFVRRLLPGRRTALLTLAHRRLGLILAAGNPQGIHDLKDLTSPGVKFVNRQSGSGTRVWLDAALHRAGISGKDIWGYEEELITHSDVAATVAGGRAGVGFGLETAARGYGLDFIPLVRERYDLAIPSENIEHPAMGGLISWLSSAAARKTISGFGGYEVEETGEQCWVE